MRTRVILFLFALLEMSVSFDAFTPLKGSIQNIAAGCGVIEGRVLDQAGHPVTGAKVSSMINDRPPRGRLMWALSDAEGRFTLTCAQPGSNMVYVSKEDEYYPDTFLSPFVDVKLIPVVNVDEQGVTGNVEVHLPPKGGKVVAQVINAETQQPVDGASITLCRADDPNKCLTINATSQNAQFEKVVPPIRLTVKVSAPGYEDWYYKKGNASIEPGKMLLAPGSTKGLTILLRPSGNKTTK